MDIKALTDRLDKQSLMMDKQSHMIDKLIASNKEAKHSINSIEEYAHEEGIHYEQEAVQDEEINYIANQGYYNPNQVHPNLSYRNTNVANPQDQSYPPPPNQGANQPRPSHNTYPRPQQGYQPRPQNQPPGFQRPQQGYQQGQGFIPQGQRYGNQGQGYSNQAPQAQPDLMSMMHQMLSSQGILTSEMVNMKEEINKLKAQSASSSRPNQLPGKAEANPKNEFINSVEIVHSNEDIASQKGGVKLVEKQFPTLEELLRIDRVKEEAKAVLKAKQVKEAWEEFEEESRNYKPPPPYVPKLPFPGRLMQSAHTQKVIPKHVKLTKDLKIEKPKEDESTMMLTYEASAIIQREILPKKLEDPGSFTIPCTLGSLKFENCLCDLGASGSLMPLSIAKELGITKFEDSNLRLILADRSVRYPVGLLKDYPVKIQGNEVPTDFIVLDMEVEPQDPIIFGRPFLATAGARIDVKKGKIDLQLSDKKTIRFDINKKKKPQFDDQCCYLQELGTKAKSSLPTPIMDDNEEAILEIEKLIHDSQYKHGSEARLENGFDPPKTEFIGGYSMIHVISPPKAELEKKKTIEKEAMGSGNAEVTLSKEEPSLDKEVKSTKAKKVKSKKAKAKVNHHVNLGSVSSSMTLTPLTYEDGVIEYKLKCKGRPKPFAKVRAILPNELKEKGPSVIKEFMDKVIVPKFEDHSRGVYTPHSPA